MKIRITILDMADPLKPYTVLQLVTFTERLEYPELHMFTLPATTDARITHPYAIVVEQVKE